MGAVKSVETNSVKFISIDKRKCYRYASEYHQASRCKFKHSNYKQCGLKGHIAKARRNGMSQRHVATACRNKPQETEKLKFQSSVINDEKTQDKNRN